MHKPQQQVREFNRAIGHPTSPALPMIREGELRASLILEEALETVCALVGVDKMVEIAKKLSAEVEQKARGGKIADRPHLIEAIDGCIDTLVVTYGALDTIGVDAEPFFDEVMKANMTKVSGPVREDGKRMKPEGWMPPDISGVLGRIHMEAAWNK